MGVVSGSALVLRANALSLPLPDESVDLAMCSPPYFALRSYRDHAFVMGPDGKVVEERSHFPGQIGSEAHPQEWLEALWAVMAEVWRVLKPTGSAFVNLGDKRSGGGGHNNSGLGTAKKHADADVMGLAHRRATRRNAPDRYNQAAFGRTKSKMLLPHRFAIGCEDGLADPEGKGWIVRQDIVWSKLNGLPESVTDRCRDSHEFLFHLVKQPNYFAAVDEVRERYQPATQARYDQGYKPDNRLADAQLSKNTNYRDAYDTNPLGKLPGSVWPIASEPLVISDEVKAFYDLPDHFACVDAETEILTPRGWLHHDELRSGEDVAGYDLDTGTARWTRCRAVNRYDYDGPVVAVEKRDLSMRLTPNHRCIVRRPHSVVPLVDEVVEAADLGPRHAIPRSAEWEPFEHKAIGEDMAALCGWVAAEGWIQNGQVRLSQSLTENSEHVTTIDRLLSRFVLLPPADRSERRTYRLTLNRINRYERVRSWRGRQWTDVTWALPLGLSQEIRRLLPSKMLPWSFVGLPDHERRAVLDAFIDGDGHRRPDGRIGIFQKECHNLDVLQAIAVTLAYKTTLRRATDKWVLYLTTGGRAISLRRTNGVNAPIPREHYKGIVWCPTTGTGTFVARRNGSVFITGNSYPTELVRRVVLGWSPSGVCVSCGEGRRPVVEKQLVNVWHDKPPQSTHYGGNEDAHLNNRKRVDDKMMQTFGSTEATITGYGCACSDASAPTRSAVCLDVFGGTGTTAGVARALGRIGVSVDLSMDYSRLAQWRIHRSGHFAKAARKTRLERQESML